MALCFDAASIVSRALAAYDTSMTARSVGSSQRQYMRDRKAKMAETGNRNVMQDGKVYSCLV